MKLMYHPSDLAAMDPLVLMKNLDHVRMTSRRLSYILQQQVHLYTPEANQLREQIDTLRRGRAPDRGRDGQAADPRLSLGQRDAPLTAFVAAGRGCKAAGRTGASALRGCVSEDRTGQRRPASFRRDSSQRKALDPDRSRAPQRR